MDITVPVEEKEIQEYDFALTNGMRICQSIDTAAGDSFEEFPDRYELFLSRKPSLMDPEEMMPQERVRVFKSQIVVLIDRKRKQRVPTEEEKFEFQKTLHKVAKGIM